MSARQGDRSGEGGDPPRRELPPARPARGSSQAQQVRALLSRASHGALSTIGGDGYPYGSIVNYALDPDGHPLLLASDLAQHTRNFLGNPRSALVVGACTSGDPLAVGRVSLIGEIERVADGEIETVRDIFLQRHPGARVYAYYGGFRFYRLRVRATRYVGGFGERLDAEPSGG